ncbi:MAG: oxidoreductase [Legionella sp.]|uniref:oxidoreductase n=1 Tax=Legionella sp. TaxID=459 RepID=UPI0039E490FD
MPKGIIRVPEELCLSQELEQSLKTQFPDYVLERYSLKPDYRKSFDKRVDIFLRAFNYMLNSLPYKPKDNPLFNDRDLLKAYAKQCKTEYKMQNQGIDELEIEEKIEKLQTELRHFTSKLHGVISQIWNVPTDAAAELLNEAEQYEIMLEGRSDIVTLSPIELKNEVHYAVQYDQILPPHYPLIINELNQLKANNYPKTPTWFRKINKPEYHYMQAFFCNLTPNVSDIKKDFNSFLKLWESITKKATYFPNDLNTITDKKNLLKPAWFSELPQRYKEMLNILALDSPSIINQKLHYLKQFINEQKFTFPPQKLAQFPQWYWVLPENQQYYLEYALKSKKTVEEAVSTLSSRQRMLPMPANYGAHQLLLLSPEGTFRKMYTEKKRSSHIATRDGIELMWPSSVLRRHTHSNLSKVMEDAKPEQAILFQTLVSPVGSDYIPRRLSSIIPDYELDKMARAIIDEGVLTPPPIFRNNPLNIAKLFLYTTIDNLGVRQFLEVVESYYDKVDGIKELVDNYKRVLNSELGTATYNEYKEGLGRELFVSSVEQLIILKINGYSYGSCVSGKDRKAVELIYTDAMYLYYEKYGSWPEFNDLVYNHPRRADFVSIVADLYLSRHQHEHAGQNAPGSEGIKTPDNYFPRDIANKINKCLYGEEASKRLQADALKIDDRMATNNEVRKISTEGARPIAKSNLSAEEILSCRLFATKLGKERCAKLYDGLFPLFSKMCLFSRETWSGLLFTVQQTPQGIQNIKSWMEANNSGNNITRIAGIFELVLGRPGPKADASRKEATKEVYMLRELLQAESKKIDSDEFIDEFIKERVAKWKQLFDNAKQEPEMTSSLISYSSVQG